MIVTKFIHTANNESEVSCRRNNPLASTIHRENKAVDESPHGFASGEGGSSTMINLH